MIRRRIRAVLKVFDRLLDDHPALPLAIVGVLLAVVNSALLD